MSNDERKEKSVKLGKEGREFLVSLGTLALSLWMLLLSAGIPIKRLETFLQSARVFPLIISVVMLLLSIAYVVTSYRKCGRIAVEKLKNSSKAFVRSPETRRITMAIVFVAVYVFAGVERGRFYVSSAVFMLFILLFYVRRIKPWISIVAALAFVGISYLLFHELFRVPIL